MKKSTIFAFAAGLAAGVLFNDRIREKLSQTKESIVSRFQASINRKTAEILHEKIDSVFGPEPEEKEEAKQDQCLRCGVTFTVTDWFRSFSSIADVINKNGRLSIADLCGITGTLYTPIDEVFGWDNLREFKCSKIITNGDGSLTITASGAHFLFPTSNKGRTV